MFSIWLARSPARGYYNVFSEKYKVFPPFNSNSIYYVCFVLECLHFELSDVEYTSCIYHKRDSAVRRTSKMMVLLFENTN